MSVKRIKDSGKSPSMVRLAFSEIIFTIVTHKAYYINE